MIILVKICELIFDFIRFEVDFDLHVTVRNPRFLQEEPSFKYFVEVRGCKDPWSRTARRRETLQRTRKKTRPILHHV